MATPKKTAKDQTKAVKQPNAGKTLEPITEETPATEEAPVTEEAIEETYVGEPDNAEDLKAIPAQMEEQPKKTKGVQFMELISIDEHDIELRAMKIGGSGVLVAFGLSMTFIPGADIVDRGRGPEIV